MDTLRALFEDQVFFNTILIENLTDGEFGTGFLLRKKIDENIGKILLFSNKHVFWGKKDMNNTCAEKKLQLTFHKRDDDGKYQLGHIIKVTLNLKRTQDGYFEHPESKVDVACINVSGAYNHYQIENKSISIDEFSNFDIGTLAVGQKVIFVGYPQGFFDIKNYLPIARFGTVASIPSIDFNGEKQILIDAQVFPGSSGSPVFFQHSDSTYKLLGIISSAPIRELDYVKISESVTDEEKEVAIKFIGLGMLFKLETLKTVFDLT